MIVGTAGHIDHGKTTLVHALTGVDTDRLKEEKARGISIELGYAYQPLANGGVLGFVDVPGHERFIHTMLAGAAGIDFALLVVAADDGVMPQTREHLSILNLLGIERGAVALSKIDRVDASRIALVEHELQRLLAGTTLAGMPVFPVAATEGLGVEALRMHLHEAAQAMPQAPGEGGFRLAVDRSFTLKGAGTVVTGTVFAGRVEVGDELAVTPSGKRVRVRSLHVMNRPAQAGQAGQRCALNLHGVGKDEIARGDWIVAPHLHAPTARFDVRLRLSPQAPVGLAHWAPVHLHLGAAHVMARVALLEGERLAPGESALAQLVADRPLGCAPRRPLHPARRRCPPHPRGRRGARSRRAGTQAQDAAAAGGTRCAGHSRHRAAPARVTRPARARSCPAGHALESRRPGFRIAARQHAGTRLS